MTLARSSAGSGSSAKAEGVWQRAWYGVLCVFLVDHMNEPTTCWFCHNHLQLIENDLSTTDFDPIVSRQASRCCTARRPPRQAVRTTLPPTASAQTNEMTQIMSYKSIHDG
jgi:hypothetical protein